MTVDTVSRSAFIPDFKPVWRWPDPSKPDRASDCEMHVSDRQLLRLASVAAATGARFEREGIGRDAMTWLTAPLRVFGGLPAIEACLDRDGFVAATLLHGLDAGIDADRDVLLALPNRGSRSNGDDAVPGDGWDRWPLRAEPLNGRPASSGARRSPRAKLYSCSVRCDVPGGGLLAFAAMVAEGPMEVRGRLSRRYGGRVAEAAEVREGFDVMDRIAMELVSEALADTIAFVAAEPDSVMAIGFEVALEKRFIRL